MNTEPGEVEVPPHQTASDVSPEGGPSSQDDVVQQEENGDDEDPIDLGESDCDADSYSDVSLTIVHAGDPVSTKKQKLQKPDDELQWDDRAISSCLELAIATHDDKEQRIEQHWKVPYLGNPAKDNFLANWKPTSLDLPLWAVDPFLTTRGLEQSAEKDHSSGEKTGSRSN